MADRRRNRSTSHCARWIAALVVVCSLHAGVASAIPLAINEATFGDFTGQNLGELGVGTNVISGAITAGDVIDPFLLTLPIGLSTASGVLSITNLVQISGQPETLILPTVQLTFDTNGDLDLAANSVLHGPMTLTYGLVPGVSFPPEGPALQDTFSYTFEIVVVPEPAAAALLALGFAAVGLSRRLRAS